MRNFQVNISNEQIADLKVRLSRTPDPIKAAALYVKALGFEITEDTPDLISIRGPRISLVIERGSSLGPVLEVTVQNIEKAKDRLTQLGCEVIKDEPDFPRCYVKDPFGLIYNLIT